MVNDLFAQLRQDANNKELQVRISATVASAAATHMVERIKTASQGAGQTFIGLMEPYRQNFQFYARLSGELDRRCSERRKMCPYVVDTTANMHNVAMFGAVAAELIDPNSKVCTSPLVPAHETRKSSRRHNLHTALHVLELAAALNPNTDPIGHIIGPVVGLVLGLFERRAPEDTPDAFLDTSRFLSQLEDIDKHLKKIAVGVYRVPDFWPRLINLPLQRARRKLPHADSLNASDPLTAEEAERVVLALLAASQEKAKCLMQ